MCFCQHIDRWLYSVSDMLSDTPSMLFVAFCVVLHLEIMDKCQPILPEDMFLSLYVGFYLKNPYVMICI